MSGDVKAKVQVWASDTTNPGAVCAHGHVLLVFSAVAACSQ